ncbi:hypothetical protein D3C72_2325540 [compost metagenome]
MSDGLRLLNPYLAATLAVAMIDIDFVIIGTAIACYLGNALQLITRVPCHGLCSLQQQHIAVRVETLVQIRRIRLVGHVQAAIAA